MAKICMLCNGPIEEHHTSVMLNHCFSCTHWHEKLDMRANPKYNGRIFVIDGRHYILGTGKTPHRDNGFGGSAMYIKEKNGELHMTCDLWHQGEIPWHWRSLMPDNACFLTKEEYNIELAKLQEKEAEANSCNVCNGDCAGANPPVINCPIQEKK